ncbi:hypothetical protein T190423A01A_40289 [Tenacibaculum sp. 190130A14a]|uniref:Uncharacterized protein n=1 Tax=Tenacibaculum polynesiense TaxID=3137857 RepID=A0ABM9PDK5_9FLAO
MLFANTKFNFLIEIHETDHIIGRVHIHHAVNTSTNRYYQRTHCF